jgi:hypothetical protein
MRKTWEATISECPHCGEEIEIHSETSSDIKDSIKSAIFMAEIHTKNCRGKMVKKAANIRLKESKYSDNYNTLSYSTDKVLI